MKSNTLFFHSAFPGKGVRAPRVTVAGILGEDGKMKFGVAKCVANDNFSRKKGRELAAKRAAIDEPLYYVERVITLDDRNTFPLSNEEHASVVKWFCKVASNLSKLIIDGNVKDINKPIPINIIVE